MKLYIYTKNQSISEGLTRCVCRKKLADIHVELLTEKRDTKHFGEEDTIVSDDVEWLDNLQCHTIQLVKRPELDRENAIFMYQGKEDLCDRLLEKIDCEVEEKLQRKGARIVCVFSPEGGDAKTMLAVKTAVECAKTKRVLYVSLCGFPVVFSETLEEEPNRLKKGISDLMMCAGSSNFEETLKSLVFHIGCLSFIAPVVSYKDLLDYTKKDVEAFMKCMRNQECFDVVIIESAQLFEHSLELMSFADEIKIPREEGFFAAVKRHVLHEYCVSEGKENVWSSITFEEVSDSMPSDARAFERYIGCEGQAMDNA